MKHTLTIVFLWSIFIVVSCHQKEKKSSIKAAQNQDSIDIHNLNQTPGLGYEFKNNGKKREVPVFESPLKDTILKGIIIAPSDDLEQALNGSKRYLRNKKRTHQLSETITITDKDIKKTIEAVQKWRVNGGAISDFVKTYQIAGEDDQGNVHFTGYYIPVLKVSKTKDETFKYPLYQLPPEKYRSYTRQEIDTEKKLAGKGLEIAYSDNLLENYTMQVQGSGVVEYPDGSRQLLSFGGKNGHPYRSLGKYLVANGYVSADKISLTAIREWMQMNPDSMSTLLNQNPSYVYFKARDGEPSGAAGVPLIAKHSVAVDKSRIPLGSVLLGEVPVLNEKGVLTGHEFRILTAHDVGGAIKKGHIDFFSGIGKEGEDVANALHHYGRIWILLPKSE